MLGAEWFFANARLRSKRPSKTTSAGAADTAAIGAAAALVTAAAALDLISVRLEINVRRDNVIRQPFQDNAQLRQVQCPLLRYG